MPEKHTDSHDDKESSHEPPKVHHSISRALHKVIRVRCTAAYPVRQWCDHVCCDDKERKIIVEERSAEYHQEESNRQNLSLSCQRKIVGAYATEQSYKG